MIVDHFNTGLNGGAGIAALRLHESLLRAGVESRLWHSPRSPAAGGSDRVRPVRWARDERGLWRRTRRCLDAVRRKLILKQQKLAILNKRPRALEMFSVPRLATDTIFRPGDSGSDIVHLHWIAKMIDYPSFFASLPDDFPIVWTLHDMNPFTGGCHHSDDCEAFTDQCRHCPQLPEPGPEDLANRGFRVKRRALSGRNLHIVTPSRWLEERVRRSRIFGRVRSLQTIHNGLDVNLFAAQEKRAARRALRLPADKFVIGFGAPSFDNLRKGPVELLDALARLRDPDRIVGLGFGAGQVPRTGRRLPELVMAGYINDPRKQVALYSAADVFVLASLGENMPQTAVEALACGTPVVAFAVGGVPEIVRPGRTGLLAPVGDARALAGQIQWLLDHPAERARMGTNARRLAVRQFDQTQQAGRYLELYQGVLADRCAGPARDEAA